MKPTIEHLRNHPPRCLAKFVVSAVDLPGVQFDGHAAFPPTPKPPSRFKVIEPGYFNPIFEISCPCRKKNFYVHCYLWENPSFPGLVTLSPLVLECATCGTKSDLFDSDSHGYDAELNQMPASARAKGNRAVFECESCGRQPLTIFARFELPDSVFEECPEFKGREQDLFTWFSLVGRCIECNQYIHVADFECA